MRRRKKPRLPNAAHSRELGDFIDELIKEADVNGDGKLDFLEFSKAMLNKEGPWGGDFTRR